LALISRPDKQQIRLGVNNIPKCTISAWITQTCRPSVPHASARAQQEENTRVQTNTKILTMSHPRFVKLFIQRAKIT